MQDSTPSRRLLRRRRVRRASEDPAPRPDPEVSWAHVPWADVQKRLVASGKQFYCICFSVRSGSSLLCEDMTQWGFGAPREHFQFPEFPVLEGPLWDHLGRLAEQWDGDFMALKISWYQATEITNRIRSEGFDSVGFDLGNVFPGLRYIHIVRRDKIRQAISTWRAQTSGTWHWPVGSDADPGQVPYDFEAINHQLRFVIAEDWQWQMHFERYGITPLTVYYEDYILDRPGHLQRIADFLGVPGTPAPLVDRIQVMRDDWTELIAERLIADLHRPH
jgi:LPS sulfotransferase NodH